MDAEICRANLQKSPYIPERNGFENMEIPGAFCIVDRDIENSRSQAKNKKKLNSIPGRV